MSDSEDPPCAPRASEPTETSTLVERLARDHQQGPADLVIGWYRDPSSPGGHRYWNGTRWITWASGSS